MTRRRAGAKVGRPPKDWRSDPDLFFVSIALGLQMSGTSENAAFKVAALFGLGHQRAAEQVLTAPIRKRGVGTIPAGTRRVSYARLAFPGQTTATFEGYASTLRRKRDHWRRHHLDAAEWLRASQVLVATFIEAGVAAGEDRETLVKLLCVFAARAAQDSRPPEYSPNLSSDPTSYHPPQPMEHSTMSMTPRDVYRALEHPILALDPEVKAVAPKAPPGSPRHVSVLILEDEAAEVIQLDPAPFSKALKGQIAAELANLIVNYWGRRVEVEAA
jgi:hypothetical protein